MTQMEANYYAIGRLVDIKEDEYEPGKFGEQWITLELDNGQKVVVMDPTPAYSTPIIKRSFIGHGIRVAVNFNLVKDVEANPRHLKGLYGFHKAGDQNGGIVAGKVIRIDPSFDYIPVKEGSENRLLKKPCRKLVVDIGIGNERVNLNSDETWVKVGDFVQVEVFRIDVSDEAKVEVLE